MESSNMCSASSARKRSSRKRKLVIDRSKELTNDDIRNQLADCSDLLTPLEIAPPTRQLMEWRESGGVKQLFSSFCLPLFHPDLKQVCIAHTCSWNSSWAQLKCTAFMVSIALSSASWEIFLFLYSSSYSLVAHHVGDQAWREERDSRLTLRKWESNLERVTNHIASDKSRVDENLPISTWY